MISDFYNIVLVKSLGHVKYLGHRITNIFLRYYNLKLCLVIFFSSFSFINLESRSRIVATK